MIKAASFCSLLPGKSGGGGWGVGEVAQRVIRIMKIAGPRQADVRRGLKVPAIKVKPSEKLFPGHVWNKDNLELPHLSTTHWRKEETTCKGKGLLPASFRR